MKYFLYLIFIFTITFLSNTNIYAQDIIKKDLSYEQIEKKIDSLQNEKNLALILINYYIAKSKRERNDASLLYAYRYASKYYPKPQKFKYADSALLIAKKSRDIKLLTDAYLNKGTTLMDEEYYQKALDQILIANKYSIDLKNEYLTYKTTYFIAQNRIYLGNYEEANQELKLCLQYFKGHSNDKSSLGENAQMFYIYSLISYLDTNTKIGKQYENYSLIKDIKEYLAKNKLQSYIPYFISIEGTDAYHKKDYQTATRKLKEALTLYDDQWSHLTEVYYLGLSNWKLGKRTVAVKYLEEIDKEYEKDKRLDPQFRSAYELLIKYNDSIGNRDQQLVYINTLMLLDRSYEKNFKYLYSKINKEYDTQKLITEKKKIERSLQLRTYVGVFLMILTIVISVFGFRFYKLQKIYKKRFDEIVDGQFEDSSEIDQDLLKEFKFSEETDHKKLDYYSKIPNLKPFLVENIVNQIKTFEKEERYLDMQISIKSLSEEFGTNYVYLSKIINVYRGKNFNTYINDLRLEYIIHLLKDKKNLDRDIKELATISGFATANSFSSNFVRRYKIKPSYFIKSLKNT